MQTLQFKTKRSQIFINQACTDLKRVDAMQPDRYNIAAWEGTDT